MAILPVSGTSKGRLTVEYRLDQASSSTSVFKAFFSFSYGLSAPGEVGVTDKEALFVVVRIYKPASYVVCGAGANLTCRRVIHIEPSDLYFQLTIAVRVPYLYVWLSKHHKEVPSPSLL